MPAQRIKLITTDPSVASWKTFNAKRDEILKELSNIKGSNFQLFVEYRDIKPKIVDGRIDTTWFDNFALEFTKQSFDFVGLHMSQAQRISWGLKPNIRGTAFHEGTSQLFYLWADEKTLRQGRNQFVQTFLHEFRHRFMLQAGLPDDTHAQHADGEIKGSFKGLSIQQYQKPRILTLIEKLASLLKPKTPATLLHPVYEYRNLISQPYGTPNAKFYPQTGHHIGTDYACPPGTPVRAPWNGEVVVSGYTPSQGNFCQFKYTFGGVTYVARFMHLTDVPEKGTYKRGEVIELSGKTGNITGAHLHVDIFYNEVRVDILTAKNFKNLTVNPETHYV